MVSKSQQGKQYQLCQTGDGSLVGEELILQDRFEYDFTATVLSQTAKVMMIHVQ